MEEYFHSPWILPHLSGPETDLLRLNVEDQQAQTSVILRDWVSVCPTSPQSVTRSTLIALGNCLKNMGDPAPDKGGLFSCCLLNQKFFRSFNHMTHAVNKPTQCEDIRKGNILISFVPQKKKSPNWWITEEKRNELSSALPLKFTEEMDFIICSSILQSKQSILFMLIVLNQY